MRGSTNCVAWAQDTSSIQGPREPPRAPCPGALLPIRAATRLLCLQAGLCVVAVLDRVERRVKRRLLLGRKGRKGIKQLVRIGAEVVNLLFPGVVLYIDRAAR